MKTLGEIRERMIAIIGRPELLNFVNARLVLRTGVSLNNAAESATSDDLHRVVVALKEMGYSIDGQGVQK
jgi:hypothetical protein